MATDPKDTQFGGAGPDGAAIHSKECAELSTKAERCRRLAAGISDRQAADVLRKMAVNYEKSAERLGKG